MNATSSPIARSIVGHSPLVVAAILLHIPLGVVVFRSPAVAALHAALVLGVGLWLLARGRPAGVLAVLAYVAGAEVLWRMARSQIPAEYGKYLTILLAGATWLVLGRRRRWRMLPILYAAALLPSVLATLAEPAVSTARAFESVRFYLAGAFALGVATLLAVSTPVDPDARRRMLLALLAPSLAVAAAMYVATTTATSIVFSTESNFTTTGGFGPNQVSTSLGAGLLAAFLLAVDPDTPRFQRAIGVGGAVVLAAATLMTFSRGGLYGALAAALVAVAPLTRSARARRRLVIAGAVLASLVGGFVLPRLDRFTGGALTARFADTEPTNRDILVLDDLRMFLRHPILGVGPGQAGAHRELLPYGMGHTEYSRMLAEHGLFGLVSLAALAAMTLHAVTRSAPPPDRAFQLACLVWALVTMLHAATRLAAPSVLFALAMAPAANAGNERVRSRAAAPPP